MRLRSFLFPVHLILAGFSPRGLPAFSILTGLVAISFLLGGLIFVGSYLDGTLHLPNGGKGFFDHYGVWAILIADPIVFISTAYSWYLFKNAFAELPLKDDTAREKVRRHVASCIKLITLSNVRGCVIYALCVVTGAFSWLNNIRQTIEFGLIETRPISSSLVPVPRGHRLPQSTLISSPTPSISARRTP